jgi:hypothetical protein
MIIFVLFFAGIFVFKLLSSGSLSLQEYLFLPPGRLFGDPIYASAMTLAAFLLVLYFLYGSILLLPDAVFNGRAGRYRSELLQSLLYTGRRGRLTAAAVLISYCLVVGYGVSAYWYATMEGLTISPGWPAYAVRYAWSDVAKRLVLCGRHKGTPTVLFLVQMRDGRTFEFASSELAKHLSEVAALTQNAENEVGPVTDCPDFIRAFDQQIRSAH